MRWQRKIKLSEDGEHNIIMGRNVLKILYGGTKTLAQDYYDKLWIPPISSLMTLDDINNLNKIIKSARLSGNAKLKEKKIDEIMKFRGFTKFAGGTNRLVYTHPAVPTAVYKVAFDAVGLNDNPSEFYNQDYIKPYCCKVFECSPCGTIASYEKVDRITTYQEFCSVAEDIFYIIYRILLGKYVLEDIGTNYFMNWGIRRGGSPCIIDFPYVYELDGDKLYCDKHLDDGSACGGEIDYDDGFNFIHCTKCNAIYRARQLAKLITKDNGILRKGKGRMKVKLTIWNGDTKVSEKKINFDDAKAYAQKNKANKKTEESDFPKLVKKVVTKTIQTNTGAKKGRNPEVPAIKFGDPFVTKYETVSKKVSLANSYHDPGYIDPNAININIMTDRVNRVTSTETGEINTATSNDTSNKSNGSAIEEANKHIKVISRIVRPMNKPIHNDKEEPKTEAVTSSDIENNYNPVQNDIVSLNDIPEEDTETVYSDDVEEDNVEEATIPVEDTYQPIQQEEETVEEENSEVENQEDIQTVPEQITIASILDQMSSDEVEETEEQPVDEEVEPVLSDDTVISNLQAVMSQFDSNPILVTSMDEVTKVSALYFVYDEANNAYDICTILNSGDIHKFMRVDAEYINGMFESEADTTEESDLVENTTSELE